MKIIDKTILSKKTPSRKNVLWIDSNDGTLRIPYKGEWKAVGNTGENSGGGSNSGSSEKRGLYKTITVDEVIDKYIDKARPFYTLAGAGENIDEMMSMLEEQFNFKFFELLQQLNDTDGIIPDGADDFNFNEVAFILSTIFEENVQFVVDYDSTQKILMQAEVEEIPNLGDVVVHDITLDKNTFNVHNVVFKAKDTVLDYTIDVLSCVVDIKLRNKQTRDVLRNPYIDGIIPRFTPEALTNIISKKFGNSYYTNELAYPLILELCKRNLDYSRVLYKPVLYFVGHHNGVIIYKNPMDIPSEVTFTGDTQLEIDESTYTINQICNGELEGALNTEYEGFAILDFRRLLGL